MTIKNWLDRLEEFWFPRFVQQIVTLKDKDGFDVQVIVKKHPLEVFDEKSTRSYRW